MLKQLKDLEHKLETLESNSNYDSTYDAMQYELATVRAYIMLYNDCKILPENIEKSIKGTIDIAFNTYKAYIEYERKYS